MLLLATGLFASGINVTTIRAGGVQDVERILNQSYKGRILLLRNFYGGDRLRYDADGKLVEGGTPGPWTVDANIEVKEIKLKGEKLQIDGQRIWLIYASGTKKLAGRRGSKIVIQIDVNGSTVSMAGLAKPIRGVFLGAQDKLEDLVPSYWKPFLNGDADKVVMNASWSGQSVEKVGGNVTAPRAIHDPDPPYTDEARAQDFEGTMLLSMIVTAQGDVRDVVIVRPLGLGLDDRAAETVSAWKFKPAVRNGVPVAVRMLVETTFRLHQNPW